MAQILTFQENAWLLEIKNKLHEIADLGKTVNKREIYENNQKKCHRSMGMSFRIRKEKDA